MGARGDPDINMLNANITSIRQDNKKEKVDITFLEAPRVLLVRFVSSIFISGAPNGAHILNAITADKKTEIHTAFSILRPLASEITTPSNL